MRFQVIQNMACLFGVLVGLQLIPSGAVADLNNGELAYDNGNYELAYSIWLPLAHTGNSTAQYNLATLYRFGQGIEPSTITAMEWYWRAASQGHVLSQVNLGRLYLSGLGLASNPSKALIWFQLAAEQGSPFGEFYLGVQYLQGSGIETDLDLARGLLLSAANQGVREAAYELGQI